MYFSVNRRLAGLFVAIFLLAACGRSPQSHEAAASRGADGEHIHNPRYAIDISYPPLSPQADALTRALHARGEAARRTFLARVKAIEAHAPQDRQQMRLALSFEVASRTSRLLSVRETGQIDTGGAHPQPLVGTFVFDMQARKVLSLDDLFVHPDKMRITLADLARKALYAKLLDKVPGGDKTPPRARALWQANMRGMIDAGTAPTASNFSRFLIDAGGLDQPMQLVLVFPPYQVAPYVYGVQTVDVPLKAFAGELKPGLRPAFGLAP